MLLDGIMTLYHFNEVQSITVRNIIIKLIFNLVKSASEEISVLFSSANAFHLLEKEGVLKARGASSKEYD